MEEYTLNVVSKGIANRFPGKRIEMHKKLCYMPVYRPLYDEILKHEIAHTDMHYSWADFLLDVKGFRNKGLYWRFILTTPSSWWQFLPIYRDSYGTYYLDWSIIILYLLGGFIAWLFYLVIT